MEDLMTSPLQQIQQWIGCSAQSRIYDEYLRPVRPTKVVTCKKGCAPFTVSVEKRTASRAFRVAHYKTAQQWMTKTQIEDALVRGLTAAPTAVIRTEARFRELASEWLSDIENVSSVTVLTSHPKYQEIISLGWPVIPYLLDDLQNKRGYWFPALSAITGIRPFDPRDAGNLQRMTEAWIKWGKNRRIN
jgi:hypothetical protein